MIKSIRLWLADRSELIRRMVELEGIIIAMRDDREADALTIADLTAERDAALAKLAPPARDAATGRWAAKS